MGPVHNFNSARMGSRSDSLSPSNDFATPVGVGNHVGAFPGALPPAILFSPAGAKPIAKHIQHLAKLNVADTSINRNVR